MAAFSYPHPDYAIASHGQHNRARGLYNLYTCVSVQARIYRQRTLCTIDACVPNMSYSARVSLGCSGRRAPIHRTSAYTVDRLYCAAQILHIVYNGSYSSARDKIFVTKSQISQERLVQLQPNFTHACTQPSGMCISNFMQFGENFFSDGGLY